MLSLDTGLAKKVSEATSLFLVAVKTRVPSQAHLDGQKTILTIVCLLPARKAGSSGFSLTFISTFLPRRVRSTLLLSDLHWPTEKVAASLLLSTGRALSPAGLLWHHCHGEWERYLVTPGWRRESRLYKSRPLILWGTRTLLLPGKMKIPASNITISPVGDWSTYSLSAFHRQNSLLPGLGQTIAFAMTFDYSQWLQSKSFLFC